MTNFEAISIVAKSQLYPESTEYDYPEEWHTENGLYQHECSVCHNIFYGHKRRIVCKKCIRGEIK